MSKAKNGDRRKLHAFRLSFELTEAIEAGAERLGTNKTIVVEMALREWFGLRGLFEFTPRGESAEDKEVVPRHS